MILKIMTIIPTIVAISYGSAYAQTSPSQKLWPTIHIIPSHTENISNIKQPLAIVCNAGSHLFVDFGYKNYNKKKKSTYYIHCERSKDTEDEVMDAANFK